MSTKDHGLISFLATVLLLAWLEGVPFDLAKTHFLLDLLQWWMTTQSCLGLPTKCKSISVYFMPIYPGPLCMIAIKLSTPQQGGPKMQMAAKNIFYSSWAVLWCVCLVLVLSNNRAAHDFQNGKGLVLKLCENCARPFWNCDPKVIISIGICALKGC